LHSISRKYGEDFLPHDDSCMHLSHRIFSAKLHTHTHTHTPTP